MTTISARFEFERSTKRKLVYQELDEAGEMIDGAAARIGTLYVSKWALDGEPKRITVSISTEDGQS